MVLNILIEFVIDLITMRILNKPVGATKSYENQFTTISIFVEVLVIKHVQEEHVRMSFRRKSRLTRNIS